MTFPVFDIPAQRAQLDPDAPALVDGGSGLVLDYAQLERYTGQAAALLAAEGVGEGDTVALLARNRAESFVLLFACARLGAVFVPLNWRSPASELAPLLDDCGARLLLHDAAFRDVASELAAPMRACLDLDDGEAPFRTRCELLMPIKGQAAREAGDTWYLLYTSGTTGQPKAVIQTFGMTVANYVNISQGMGLRGGDRTLCFLPLFHSGGVNLTALPTLMLGGLVQVVPEFDAGECLSLIGEGRLDTFFGVPAVYQALAEHEAFERTPLDSVRCWGCGGAPIPDSLLRRYAERGVLVLNGMGMTETGPTVFLMDEAHALEKLGSVGKPQLLSQIRVVDADGRDVSQGETGELWFAGPGMTPGYLNQPEATAELKAGEGWIRSGDLARQDEDGYTWIVGRLKDMFISGGENVYPAEVENQLAAHPAILEAAVRGVPDARWGEVGCAWLLPRPGAELPPERALQDWLRERLAAFKVPVHFVIVSEFPRTGAGKVRKHLLAPPPGVAA